MGRIWPTCWSSLILAWMFVRSCAVPWPRHDWEASMWSWSRPSSLLSCSGVEGHVWSWESWHGQRGQKLGLPRLKIRVLRASLVAQWLRVRLPMQGTRVQSLVREDPTCCRATKPVCPNDWACALEPASHKYWARVLQLLSPAPLEPMLCSKRSHRSEKPTHCKGVAPTRRN